MDSLPRIEYVPDHGKAERSIASLVTENEGVGLFFEALCLSLVQAIFQVSCKYSFKTGHKAPSSCIPHVLGSLFCPQ